MNDTTQLPAYSSSELASLDLLGLIALMITDEDRVPRNVIDECARRGDAMVEHLDRLVADSIDWHAEITSGEWWLRLHAIMILGLIPSEAVLILHWVNRPIRVKLHNIALPHQTQPFRPNRQGKFHARPIARSFMRNTVNTRMLGIASCSVDVIGELALQIDQPATPWAIGVLVEGGDVD